jgi:acid-sensing ion channel, other
MADFNFNRIFWCIVLVVSFLLTGLLIHKLLKSMKKNPIVMYSDENSISVTDINFPSLSYCETLYLNFTGFSYDNITKTLKNGELHPSNLTHNQLQYLQILAVTVNDDTLSNLNLSVTTDDLVERLEDFRKLMKLSNQRFYDRVAANWTEKFDVNLTQTLGPNGLCYTFNFPGADKMFNLDELSNDFNYSKIYPLATDKYFDKPKLHEYPLKTPDYTMGLEISFEHSIAYDGYWGPKTDFVNHSHPSLVQDGYKLVLHDPFEVPSTEAHQFYTRVSETFEVEITPEVTSFDVSLEQYSPEERNCYFKHEKTLKFFKVYTKLNCEQECLAEQIKSKCSCVQFYIVRDKNTQICGNDDRFCVQQVTSNFMKTKSNCKCLDPCEKIKYIYQIKSTSFKE